MKENKGAVTFQGNPLTLLGKVVKGGDDAPDVELVKNDLSPFKLSSLRGKVCVMLSVPSLDTPVCDTETRKFNKAIEDLDSDVHLLAISMDLPFAQARWCGAAGVKVVQTLSDYREASFGHEYGLLIKELRLLARAVIIVDREGDVKYVELIKEITDEPDYARALEKVKTLL